MKRILAFILATIMNISTLPMVDGTVAPQSNTNTANDEYVSLPITIRDYAADGMLFEYNDQSNSGPQNVGATVVQPALKITAKSGGGAFNATTANGYVRYTATSDGTYLTYSIGGQYTRTAIRYCVVSYRTNSAVKSGSTPTIGHRWNNGSANDYKTFAQTGYNKGLSGSFYNVVTDLGTGSEAVSYVTLYPRLPSGKVIDIAYIAFFANKADADNYAKNAAGSNGKNYSGGNNLQFGLLTSNGQTHDYSGQGVENHMNSYLGTDTALYVNAKSNPNGVVTTLPNGAKETVIAGRARTGLVSTELGANKHMVYNQKTVDYLAWLLEKTLTVKESNGGNSYNFNYVMGTKAYDDNGTKKELAAVLRESIKSTGSYQEAKAKYDAGGLTDAKLCTTYYEAAYFLLHNTFADSKGYGQTISNYNSLRLMQRTADDGSVYYCFNSAYNDTDYNYNNGYIANTSFVYDKVYNDGWYGISIPALRFDPIGDKGYGPNDNKYRQLADPTYSEPGSDYYKTTNYNMTLEGHAQFVYYQDDSLYFTFTGDDDVYLFINGKLVMDLGGGHAISKVSISLNDVRELCGLKDGQVYDFDFYYMERHGTAANFGIETNIKIVDPSMITTKDAYQDGVSVGNHGYVDPSSEVTYQFTLKNNGDAKIEELTFDDDILGVSLTKDKITLNNETNIKDLSVTIVDKDNKPTKSYAAGKLSEADLKALLQNGLDIGDKITIYGIKYTIPTASWANNKFVNTVNTTAISRGENASHRTLNGIASCTVQKQDVQYEGLHYYEWMGKSVTATKAELIEAVTKANIKNPGENIQLCAPNGRPDTTTNKYNENATVNADGSITYKGTKTGADTYYYKVGNYGPVTVTVYSYDVADNIYVLDYSLPVELNDAEHGLLVNDTLSLAENKYGTTATTHGIVEGSATSDYGKFKYTSGSTTSLKYTLEKFMNGVDQVKIKVMVLENGATTVTNKTGVVMEETVSVVPANVVYYEDDFTGITYIEKDGNMWTQEGTNNGTQSADQNSPYGSDPNYSKDTLLADESDASNGTLRSLTVATTADVMSFEFRGTGFEILSRTTQEIYAVVSVKVERKEADGTYTVVKQFPVITESKGGDLYQVPIISVTDLPWSDYKVTLKAAGSTETKTRVLYIDGIRIYHPLDGVGEVKYYNPDEAHAEFDEVKSLIGNGNAVYAEIGESGDEKTLATGTTIVEDRSGEQRLTDAEDLDEYLKFGPNNELYLDGAAYNTFLALYLYPDSEVAENARTIQIGAHRKANLEPDGYDPENQSRVDMVYGSTADDIIAGKHYYTIYSGTEQYYEIDPDDLVYDEAEGRYLLLVGTNDYEHTYHALALTNLKISGYTIGLIENEITEAAEANAIENSPALVEFKALQDHYKSLIPPEKDDSQINEDLVINSAALKSKKIVSGKNATLTVKCAGDAATLVVLDADGNAVEFKKCGSSVKNDITTFSAVWSVTGSRGDELNYTVVVYDSNGLRSSNTMPITVTIK